MSDPTPNLPNKTTSSGGRKPQVSFGIATAFGLGYLPKAPGTFGSLAGVGVTIFYWALLAPAGATDFYLRNHYFVVGPQAIATLIALFVSGIGVVVADRVANYSGKKDPQFVVIDEVSGQLITYLGLGTAAPNWKYLLLGFILFRVFDIWKPFPARQAESLPGGLGIMADDWMAGIYAALGLWIARAMGL
jgi:phosphatidylglycerophosphatase A